MSHFESGPLAGYNSLMDPHLAAYFQNTRMKRHLRKSGLITRNGDIISENSHRLMMARKEHQKHVRDLLAQAIVHKTLDMERTRQVAIKKKLEEIAKIEMVNRVKGEPSLWSKMIQDLQPIEKKKSPRRNNSAQTSYSDSSGEHPRRGDEDILPYLSASPRSNRNQRPSSVPASGHSRRRVLRPTSAAVMDGAGEGYDGTANPPTGQRGSSARRGRRKKRFPADIDDKHLYSLNSQALREYTMMASPPSRLDQSSPYLHGAQITAEMVPVPPRGMRASRRRIQHTDRLGRPARGGPKNGLMLHRQEPAMRHQERIQTLCQTTLRYFGSHLRLDYERMDPRDEVMVEQQHCGGNTLIVFREKILPKSDFTFISRRHRGYPFSLTIYINGKADFRLSACCEYKHAEGARLGGSQGHFAVVHIDGAAPCYKCQINENVKSKEAKKMAKKAEREREKSKTAKEDEKADKENEDSEGEEDDEDKDYPDDYENDDDEAPSDAEGDGREVRGLSDEEEEEEEEEEEGKGSGTVQVQVEPEDTNDEAIGDEDYSDAESGEDKGKSTARSSTSADDEGNTGRSSRSRSRSRSRSSSRSSSGRSKSRSPSPATSRSNSAERTGRTEDSGKDATDNTAKSDQKPGVPPSVPPIPEVAEQRAGDDVHSSARSGSSASSETNRSSGSERSVDSDRRKSPRSVGPQDGSKDEGGDLAGTFTKDDPMAADLRNINANNHTEQAEQEEEGKGGADTARPEDTLTATDGGEGGEDTLRAMTDEMAKVLEDSKKEESTVEKSRSSSSRSSSSSSSSSSDSDSENEEDAKKKPEAPGKPDRTTTDAETSDNAGGHDPDHVAGESGQSPAHLAAIGVSPGPVHSGPIRPLVAGRTEIELTSLSITPEQVTELAEEIEKQGNVKSLVLRNSGLDDEGMAEITRALKKSSPCLKLLNVNCNKIGPPGVAHVLGMLSTQQNLEMLLLHGNPLYDFGVETLIKGLVTIHQTGASDDELSAIREKAREIVAGVIRDAIQTPSLESVASGGSSSTSGTIPRLIAQSERLTAQNMSGLSLRQLDLGDSRMTSVGAQAVGELLQHNVPIHNLCLTANKGIGIAGWDAISQALKANNVLTTLSMDYNDLGDAGAAIFAEGLKQNKGLRSVDLEKNNIGADGAQKILEAIRDHPTVQDITLMPGNNIPEAILQEIKEILSAKS